MVITATELKTNLGRYLEAAKHEDVYVTRRGKVAVRISSPSQDRVATLDSLVGIAAGAGAGASAATSTGDAATGTDTGTYVGTVTDAGATADKTCTEHSANQ